MDKGHSISVIDGDGERNEDQAAIARANREGIRARLKGLMFGGPQVLPEQPQPTFTEEKPKSMDEARANRERIRSQLKGHMFGGSKEPLNFEAKENEKESSSMDEFRKKYATRKNSFQFVETDLHYLEIAREFDGFFFNRSFADFYEEGFILGEGTVATVKKCVRRADGQEFAVKISRTRDWEIILALKKEFVNLKRLNHPNVIKVFELYYSTETNVMHLVMEYSKGRELFEVISEMGRYTERLANKIFVQILRAIEYLHSQGVTHRDLKPNNILITSSSEVKIVDFNVAKFCDDYKTYDSFSKNNYQMLTYTGTIAFTAPEVFQGGEYTESVDVWSAGVVLFTMLCGYQPFRSTCAKVLIDEIIEGKFDFPENEWSDISVEAKDLVSKCLMKLPEQRILPISALSHPWILDHNKDGHNLTPKIQANLSQNPSRLVRSKFFRAKANTKKVEVSDEPRCLSALLRSLSTNKSVSKVVETFEDKINEEMGDELSPMPNFESAPMLPNYPSREFVKEKGGRSEGRSPLNACAFFP